MDVLRLRKLSWKSLIGFGKFADMTVHQVYSLKHTQYLRWVYFNSSKISFTDEILDLLIPKGFRIDKPGKNENLGKLLDSLKEQGRHAYLVSEVKKGNAIPIAVHNRVLSSIKRKKLGRFLVSDRKMFSKSRLIARNHGH